MIHEVQSLFLKEKKVALHVLYQRMICCNHFTISKDINKNRQKKTLTWG
jgi:hypothetical protein